MNRTRTQLGHEGFSLLELILVMVLVAITMAMVAPRLGGFADSRRTEDTANQMLLLIRQARTQAIVEAAPHRFNVDVDAGEYYLTIQDGGAFEPIASDYGRRFKLPADMRFEWFEPNHSGTVEFLEIDASGLVEPGRFRLLNTDGSGYELASDTVADAYRITHVKEDG